MVSVIRPGRLKLLEVEIDFFKKIDFFDFHVLSLSKLLIETFK